MTQTTKKQEKQGIWAKISSIPYYVMNRYVHAQDNTDDFQTMYSFTWFIAMAAMVVLIGICFWVDFQVLYGIEFNSTMDENHSYWSAFKSATIIQFLIIVCGGLFFKILIFNKLKSDRKESFYFFEAKISKRHLIQCCTFGILFLYGFFWTLDLAYKTYNSAKANALANQIDLDNKYKGKFDELTQEQTAKFQNSSEFAARQIKDIEQNYNAQIAIITQKYEARKTRNKIRFENKIITRQTFSSVMAEQEAALQKELSPLLKEKTAKINTINEAATAELSKLKSHYQELESNLDYQASRDRNDLNGEIENTALETQGRNIKYNLISVVLMIGLLFFAKGCLEDKNTGNTQTDPDEHIPGSIPHDNSNNQKRNNTKNNTVNTDDTQGEYIDFEEEENTNTQNHHTDEEFKQDGYEFRRKFGKVYIRHGSAYADLSKLKIWYKTYSDRVEAYTKEGKIKTAKENATMASIIAQKINYLKDHFVTDHGHKQTSTNT